MTPSIERRYVGGRWQTVEVDEGGGGQFYVPGTDEICVSISNAPFANGDIDWSTGGPFIVQIGTAITTSGPDIVIGEDGGYDVQVHLTQLPSKQLGTDDWDIRDTTLRLTAGARSCDGDDNFCPGKLHDDGSGLDRRRTTTSFRWTLAAGDTVHAQIVAPGADETYAFNAVCQVFRLSNIALPVGA